MEEEVREAALTSFFKEELYKTRDETGILIFISVFEHKVWVLADKGINAKVPENHWEGIVSHVTEGIKSQRQGDAICEAVTRIGKTLKAHFPVKPDDINELKNLIVEND
jgi:putative membrane protein